jgi:putative tricarboxylic transport membrane protein
MGFNPASLSFLLIWSGAFVLFWGVVSRVHSDRFSLQSGVPVFLTLLAAHIVFLSFQFESIGGEPSAGIIPLWIAGLLCAFSLIQSVLEIKRGEGLGQETAWKNSHWQLYLIFALIALYLFLIPRAGFYASSAAFLLISFSVLGSRRLVSMVGVTACWCLLVYLLFSSVLQVPLPAWGGA